jgi:hypothetical protein
VPPMLTGEPAALLIPLQQAARLHLGEGEGKGPIISLSLFPHLPMPLAKGGRFAYNRFVSFLG